MKLITDIFSDYRSWHWAYWELSYFKASLTSLSAEFLPATDDDAMSIHSDFSEASEMVSSV